MTLKIGTQVKIKYDKVERAYARAINKVIKLSKQNKTGYSPTLARQINSSELKYMHEYDEINGDIRTILKIYTNHLNGKNIKRYELDNDYVYYKDELEEITLESSNLTKKSIHVIRK